MTVLLLLCGLWAWWERRALRVAGIGPVAPGAHRQLVPALELVSLEVGREILAAFTPTDDSELPGESEAPDASQQPLANSTSTAKGDRSQLMDGLVPGGLAAGAGLADWWHVSENVLGAVGQWTHGGLHNHFDLAHTMADHGYHLDKAQFYIKLRGHVAEQDVIDQLSGWAGSDLTVPDASNNPAFDLTLGGHDFNVKVGPTANTIAEHLREHPDIPVMVNSDMTGLPADAVHVDLTQAVDPEMLAEHSVVVVDGLTLSDLHDQIADALGPTMDGFDIGDIADGLGDLSLPMLGSAIRIVRSGIREKKLIAHHGDKQRAVKNIATDTAIVGSSVAAGGALGVGLGALIDIASFGLTAGFGTTVIGPAIGSWLGGRRGSKLAANRRRGPLEAARAEASTATTAYLAAVDKAVTEGNEVWVTTHVPAAQAKLDSAAQDAERQMGWVIVQAERDLTRIEADVAQLAEATVEEHADRMTTTCPRAALVRQRRRAWLATADRALTAHDTGACLDLLSVLDGARPSVKALLVDASRRQATVLATTAEAARRIDLAARGAHLGVLSELHAHRAALRAELEAKMYPAALNIWEATQKVRMELVATATATPEWVRENVPDVPRPVAPALG